MVSSTVVCELLIGHILHSSEVVSLVFLAPPCFPSWWKVIDRSAVDDFNGPNSGEVRLDFSGDAGAPTRKPVYCSKLANMPPEEES